MTLQFSWAPEKSKAEEGTSMCWWLLLEQAEALQARLFPRLFTVYASVLPTSET